jgi:adenosine deaminase
VCVLSNVRTGVVANAACHPAHLYYQRGIPLSINTDDPTMFGNSLAEEYLTLHQYLGFSRTDIRRLVEQGIETSWLSVNRKEELMARFRVQFANLDREGVQ